MNDECRQQYETEVKKLTAENEKLVDAIESVHVDLEAAREEIKDKVEALEKIKILNANKDSDISWLLEQALKDKDND